MFTGSVPAVVLVLAGYGFVLARAGAAIAARSAEPWLPDLCQVGRGAQPAPITARSA